MRTGSSSLAAGAAAPGLRSQVLTLGRARALESATQLVLPMVLVRLLPVEEYGQYRLFWLATATLTLVMPLGMPRSLLYFLPRLPREERATYVGQTLLVLAATGLAAALLLSPANPWRPAAVAALPWPWLAGFAGLSVLTTTLDYLPNADGDLAGQAWSLVGLAALRAGIVTAAALAGGLPLVFAGLAAYALARCGLLLVYVARRHGWPELARVRRHLRPHLSHAIPFGLNASLFQLRRQAELWLVALMFPANAFAIFTVGVTQLPVVDVARQVLADVTLPRMSALQAQGRHAQLLAVNQRANLAAAVLIFPVVAFLFAFAREALAVAFTPAYLEAAPVLRISLLAVARMAVDASGILMAFSQRRFVLGTGAVLLAVSVATSGLGAWWLGPVGAALGS
ncbi:MAG: oligosaccharide flippase family protein, partial [Thermodesulfobacteriota bacterium]